MAHPARRRLRTARHPGLTSPEPVTTPTGRTATQTPEPDQDPDKPQNSKRRETRAQIHHRNNKAR